MARFESFYLYVGLYVGLRDPYDGYWPYKIYHSKNYAKRHALEHKYNNILIKSMPYPFAKNNECKFEYFSLVDGKLVLDKVINPYQVECEE